MHASLKLPLSALIALALATPAMAQDSRRPTSGSSSSGSTAAPRGGGSSAPAGASSSGGSGGSSVSSPSGSSSGVRGGAVAARPNRQPRSAVRRGSSGSGSAGAGASIPSYSRPRGDKAVRGEAIDRGDNPLPPRGGDAYYYPYYGYDRYNGYYGYNGYYNPYRYGMYPVYTGYGFFYYDPFWGGYAPYYGHGGYYSHDRDDDDRDYNIGSLRLKVDPSEGEVFVDGLYRGVVDDFDGIFQRLKLEAGAHQLEIRAPGYAPLVFDVLVTPGETTTYRGRLRK